LDRKENDRAEEEARNAMNVVMKNGEIDYDKVREIHRQITQKTLDELDELINSWWVWGNTKLALKISRAIVADHATTTDGVIFLLDYCELLRKAVISLNDRVHKLGGTTETEMKDIKTRLDAILENPAVKEIGKILTETEELMAKKDKNRRQILRDSIV
jgi:hypothetical protein